MRPRASIGGPLVLIAIGFLFLIHTLSPSFNIGMIVAQYWPYFLILWGVLQLLEIFARALRGGPVPPNGVSAGGWGVVLVIIMIGLISWAWHRPGVWWQHNVVFGRTMDMFGQAHDYSFDTVRKPVGKAPRVLIESFRGDAKIAGADTTEISVSGRKTIRTMDGATADRANRDTPVEVIVHGNTVMVRCNQDKAGERSQISTDMDILLPRGSTIEATGRAGDLDIASITGAVDVTTDNGTVRIDDITGDVNVDTRRSDDIHCSKVNGSVSLRGHGSDVDLSKIGGQVSISGDYNGSISLREISKPVRVESMRTQLDAQAVPGSLVLERGSLEAQNVTGPVKVATQATDVTFNGFSDAVDIAVDRGDIQLKPAHLPLGKMTVRTRSGDIDVSLPDKATVAVVATTNHSEIQNDFSPALKEDTREHGARLEGAIG
jgi:DUF4097 and DUF4098 domain-containing protein YvlB